MEPIYEQFLNTVYTEDFSNAPIIFSLSLPHGWFEDVFHHFLSAYTMDHDLPYFRFAHAVHSDVTLTLLFSDNCEISSIFKSKRIELVAKYLTRRKNKKVSEMIGNTRLITHQVAAFLCLRQS